MFTKRETLTRLKTLNGVWHRSLEQADISYRFHDLRHTFAMRFLKTSKDVLPFQNCCDTGHDNNVSARILKEGYASYEVGDGIFALFKDGIGPVSYLRIAENIDTFPYFGIIIQKTG